MSFLAPLFLAGLAALAVPVLIHLIQRERKQVVAFPSLMFVRRIPYSSIRRRRIHNWALLLLRLAALALIVAAFARPFVRGTPMAAAASGARDIVVLLDRSYSMGHGDQWERARQAARDVIAGMASGDRATVILFATEAEVAVPATDDQGSLRGAVDGAALSAAATKYGPALKLAGSLLSTSNYPRREVALVTDFQRGGWSPGDGLRLPAGATLTPIAVPATATRNVAVTPATVQREQVGEQERITVTAGVLNRSSEAIADLPVALELNGLVAHTVRVTLEPMAAGTVLFPPVTLTTPNTRATVRVADDALAADNAFHFVLSPPRAISLVIVNGTRGSREQALYLGRALAIGDAPAFAPSTRSLDELTDDVLATTRVVILNDASPSDAVVSRLQRFAEGGGGLLVALGSQATWPSSAAALLPVTPAGSVDRSRGAAGALGNLEYGHRVFEPFRAPRSGDFAAVRFYGYRRATPDADAQVLARFDDGAPALVAGEVGKGRVLVWTSTLDLFWSDLAVKPVYLPFVHQVIRHLADYRERPTWASVGEVLDLSREGDPSRPRVALTPGGGRVTLEGEAGLLLTLEEQGFYEVRERDRQAQVIAVAAANVELAESDRTTVEAEEIVVAVGGAPGGGADGLPGALPDAVQERSQRIWWFLLFAGILLLTGESVLAQRLSKAS